MPVALSFSSVGARDPDLAADALRNSALRVVPIALANFGVAPFRAAVLAEEVLFMILGAFGAVERGFAAPREITSGLQEVCFEA